MKHSDFDEVMIVNPSPPGFDPVPGDNDMMGFYGSPHGMGEYVDDDYDDYDGGEDYDLEDEADMHGYAEMDEEGPYGAYLAEPAGYASHPMPGYGWGAYDDLAAPMYVPMGHVPMQGMPMSGVGMAPLSAVPAYAAAPYGYAQPGFAPAPAYDYDEYSDYDEYDLDDYDDFVDADYDHADPDYDMVMEADADYDDYDYDDYDDVDEFAYDGYERERPPAFNPIVAAAANLKGWQGGGLAGYTRPETVNASCTGFKARPGRTVPLPDTLQPLW